MSNKKNLFWDKLFKDDVVHQANFVEIAGWLGFAAFACFIMLILPVRMDITVPVRSAHVASAPTAVGTIEAELDQAYFLQVHAGQKVQIEAQARSGARVKLAGKVAAVDLQPGNPVGKVFIEPFIEQKQPLDLNNLIKVNARIVTDRKRLVNIFMGENKIKDLIF